jgi:hypothetical protein
MPEHVILCEVPTGLADHVVQLLADAGIRSGKGVPQPDAAKPPEVDPPAVVYIVVEKNDTEKAVATVGLVLPQLFERKDGENRLSDRLVRSDEPGIEPLPVWRGSQGSVLDESDASDDLHDEEGNFVPPVPPPVPKPKDRIARFAWAAVFLGPILLVVALVTNIGDGFLGLGIMIFFAGFGTLIARYETRTPHDDGYENGAVL